MNASSAIAGTYTPPWAASLWSALQRGGSAGGVGNAMASSGAGGPSGSSGVSGVSGSNSPVDWASLSGAGTQLASGSGATALSGASAGSSATLLQRAAQLGQATVDAATQFISTIAQSLFGASAGSLQIGFDSAQLSASSDYSSSTQTTADATGQQSVNSRTSQTSSDLVATGTMVTSDGQRFNFQVEVQLQLTEQSSVSASTDGGTGSVNPQTANSVQWSSGTPLNVAITTSASSANSSAASAGQGAVVFPDSMTQLLSLLHRGQFSQPLQWTGSQGAAGAASSTANAGTGSQATTVPQNGVLTFSLLNQLPSATPYSA